MGTRNLTVVIQNDEPKVAQYGQWDGYPSGNGVEILEFLSKNSIAEFRKRVEMCRFLTDQDIKEIEEDIKLKDHQHLTYRWQDDYPQHSRDMGCGILDYILNEDDLRLKNDIDFGKDGVFCEWCYVINLDTDSFEVYGNYPGDQLASYGIHNLPTEEQFLSDLEDE